MLVLQAVLRENTMSKLDKKEAKGRGRLRRRKEACSWSEGRAGSHGFTTCHGRVAKRGEATERGGGNSCLRVGVGFGGSLL